MGARGVRLDGSRDVDGRGGFGGTGVRRSRSPAGHGVARLAAGHGVARLAAGLVVLLVATVPRAAAQETAPRLPGPSGAVEGRPRPWPGSDETWNRAIFRFAQRLADDVAADGVGGLTAAVAVGEAVVWAGGFGWADPGRRIRAGVGTIYRIGSISKSITAFALLRLAERGVLSLDDPVEKYLPEVRELADPPEGSSPITLRQLASHTAGLTREPELEGAAAGPIADWEEKLLASIPRTRFRSRPGTEFSYSNIGYGILGLAISQAAGTPFVELVRRQVFEPLGMVSSAFVIPPAWHGRLAVGFVNWREGEPPDAELPAREHAGRGYKVPNGGVYATVGDLARFVAAVSGVAGDGALSPASRREMLTLQTPPGREGDGVRGYGLGFFLEVGEDGVRRAYHGGSVAGYNAHVAFHPATGIAVILLRNYNRGRTNLGRAAAELLEELVRAESASLR